jgi:hypothetical protein
MNKLEKQILNRLKHFLLKYKMDIVDGSDIKDTIFMPGDLVLVDLDVSSLPYYPYYWTSINDILFSPDNIFMLLYRNTRAADIRCCIGNSLEEIIINMDLIGI